MNDRVLGVVQQHGLRGPAVVPEVALAAEQAVDELAEQSVQGFGEGRACSVAVGVLRMLVVGHRAVRVRLLPRLLDRVRKAELVDPDEPARRRQVEAALVCPADHVQGLAA